MTRFRPSQISRAAFLTAALSLLAMTDLAIATEKKVWRVVLEALLWLGRYPIAVASRDVVYDDHHINPWNILNSDMSPFGRGSPHPAFVAMMYALRCAWRNDSRGRPRCPSTCCR